MKTEEAPVEIPMAQTHLPHDPARLEAQREQLLREAGNAERYGHWAQSARLHAEAARLGRLLEQLRERVA